MHITSSSTNEEFIGGDCAQWYALYVRSNQEKNVAESLNIRGIENFLPCYRSLRRWKDRRVTLELPLFPATSSYDCHCLNGAKPWYPMWFRWWDPKVLPPRLEMMKLRVSDAGSSKANSSPMSI